MRALLIVVTLLILMWISYRDYRVHRIEHTSLLLLIVLLALQQHESSLKQFIYISLFMLFLYLITNIGMGDIKLLLVLGLFRSNLLIRPTFIALFSAISLISTLLTLRRMATLKTDIALGPSISLAFIAVYLGI